MRNFVLFVRYQHWRGGGAVFLPVLGIFHFEAGGSMFLGGGPPPRGPPPGGGGGGGGQAGAHRRGVGW
jgi:hypothetical protein